MEFCRGQRETSVGHSHQRADLPTDAAGTDDRHVAAGDHPPGEDVGHRVAPPMQTPHSKIHPCSSGRNREVCRISLGTEKR